MIKLILDGGERLGNQLLQNAGVCILSKKYNYQVANYFSVEEAKQLKMELFSGDIQNLNLVYCTDDNLLDLLSMSSINFGILYKGYFQVLPFLEKYRSEIRSLFKLPEPKPNNNLFIHIRLTDVARFNPGIEYYQKAISQITFDRGYIASDDFKSEIVQELAKQFNLQICDDTPVKTIDFGRQCNNIIISNGTFSWWIAFLSNAKNIFYPKNSRNLSFHPFIYFTDWIGI